MTDLDVTFTKVFGAPPSVTARAPGRVNLIGAHSAYAGGLVLPLAIPQQTRVALSPRRGKSTVRAVSDIKGGDGAAAFELGSEALRGAWIDYVAGTVAALHGAGYDVGAFELVVGSSVPIGAGLAASAALEVALLRGLRAAFELDLDDVALAKIGRVAEAEFVGGAGGIMDQMAASLADAATALLLDTRTLGWQRLPLPPDAELLVIDSGVTSANAALGRARRRAECERAAELLGVELLRDVADPVRVEGLPDPLPRRARHVLTENARVLEAAAALRAGDPVRLGALLGASHASMRDDFEASTPAVDRLVTIAERDEDVFGARMTGGGFGGAIVALARRGHAASAARRVVRAYGGGRVLVPAASEER